jgi:hypothetical protein
LGKNSQQRGNRERRVAIIGLGTYRRPSGRFKRFSSTEFLVVTPVNCAISAGNAVFPNQLSRMSLQPNNLSEIMPCFRHSSTSRLDSTIGLDVSVYRIEVRKVSQGSCPIA